MENIIKTFADNYIQKKIPNKYSKNCSSQKQQNIREFIKYNEFEKLSTNKKVEALENISLKCAKYILNEIINNNYSKYSEVDVFSSDNPDKEQYDWIVYCDSEI